MIDPSASYHYRRPSTSEGVGLLVVILLGIAVVVYWLVWTRAFHFTNRQTVEILAYFVLALSIPACAVLLMATRRARLEKRQIQPPLVMGPAKDDKHVRAAWKRNAVVLGYDIHGDPWLWPDSVRVMQGIVLGMTGSGKSTLRKIGRAHV